MNNGSTRITYERVQQDAEAINKYKKDMEDIFNDVTATMNQAIDPNTQEGKVANAIKSKFHQLEGRFRSYTSRIEQLHDLIIANAAATQTMEQKQQAEAENLSN